MELMLEKLARQLNSLDEASLLSLWGHFAARVERFEPTKRWEEAALCLCLCQSVRWKNQLFNHHFAASLKPRHESAPAGTPQKRDGNNQIQPPTLGAPLSAKDRPETPQVPDPFQFHFTPGAGKKQAPPRPGKVLAFGKKNSPEAPKNT